MTIEDIIRNHNDRLTLLDGFLRTAHFGRRVKETPVACKVRRRLIVEIEEMIAFEREELADIEDYVSCEGGAVRKPLAHAAPAWMADALHEFTMAFDKTVLLDADPRIDRGRAFDPAMGRWYLVEQGYPKRVAVSTEDLGGVADLLRRMEESLDISFCVQRNFWNEDALVAWALAQEARDVRRE